MIYLNKMMITKPMKKRIMVFMLAIVVLSMAACEDSDNDINTGEEFESAYIMGLRTITPGGTIYYLGAYPEIPASFDLSEMIELGTGMRLSAFGEHAYVWNGNAGTLTKYSVSSNLTLQVEVVMSFASTGVTGDFGSPAFFSETQAYFFALSEGKIFEFSPETMTITETIDVPVLASSEDPNATYGPFTPFITQNKVVLPIGYFPDNFNIPNQAAVAVFDPNSKSLTTNFDDRMAIGDFTFVPSETGEFYYGPSVAARVDNYATTNDHPTTGGLLKVNEDGTFDTDFFIDLKALLNAGIVSQIPFVFDNKTPVTYVPETTEFPAEWFETFGLETNTVLIDVETGTVIGPYTGLDKYRGWAQPIGGDKSGTVYWEAWHFTENGESRIDYLLTQNGLSDWKEVSTFDGNGQIWLVHQAR